MDSDDKSPFMKMIEREYKTISKNYFKTVANKNLSKEDNEDIFHDTIIKCDKLLKGKDINEDEMKSYLYKSLKTNGYREAEYYRNKKKFNCEFNCEIPEFNESPIQEIRYDLNQIQTYIRDKYGQDMLDIIDKRMEGYTIKELEESTGKKGLNYKINKILKKVRRIFK